MMRMPTALGCMLSGINVSLISYLLPSSVSDRNACTEQLQALSKAGVSVHAQILTACLGSTFA